jgi:hypothetical protein
MKITIETNSIQETAQVLALLNQLGIQGAVRVAEQTPEIPSRVSSESDNDLGPYLTEIRPAVDWEEVDRDAAASLQQWRQLESEPIDDWEPLEMLLAQLTP